MTIAVESRGGDPGTRWYNEPKIRAAIFQAVLLAIVVFLIWEATWNAIDNLQRNKVASGFGFWDAIAGFDISDRPIEYSATSTYGRAFLVGLLNTLKVSVIGIVLATILGFIIGVMRLSTNWLVAKIATVYVELIRNLPLLLQLFFWYGAVLKPLPGPRQSLSVLDGSIFLNNRGIYFPALEFSSGAEFIAIALALALIGSFIFARWARRRQMATGKRPPVLAILLLVILGLPLIAFLATGAPVSMNFAELSGFNLIGGYQVYPEFAALTFGLVTYTAAFIAEIVRGGILGISHGQTEAARAVGLRNGPTLRLVIIPQALRIIIPPLTNQYLNLTKNSSLAVAIGYPDLVQIFAGTVLNQTGQAIECIAITMAVYLFLSLVISAVMNWYNARVALVER